MEKRAVLVWISRDKDLVKEMLELCASAGYLVEYEIGQAKREPDPKYYMGPGKIQEIGALEVEHIVTTSDLTPSQLYNISSVTGKIVSDRTRVILDLFQTRVSSPEARMQVEIADLRYQLPVLREYIHQGKLSERPGFMAGGEYKIDYYFEMIKKRISTLRKKVDGERRRRGRKRSLRRRRGAHLVSIAGYTNAGKSTLMNRLMVSDRERKRTEVGPRMFTTISTTTRRMKGERGCLISDTVGFIKDLPPWLVEGFMSTLEEIFEADVVLLVLDSSEEPERFERKLGDSLSILQKGGTRGKVIIIPNKIDSAEGSVEDLSRMVRDSIPEGLSERIEAIVPVSALNDTGVQGLIEVVEGSLPPLARLEIEIPFHGNLEELLNQIRKHSVHMEERYTDNGVIVLCKMEEMWVGHFMKKVSAIDGEAVISGGKPEADNKG